MMIRRYLEKLRWVREPVDLVEHRTLPADGIEESLWISETTTDARELAIEVLESFEALAEDGFPDPANPGELDHRGSIQGFIQKIDPERTLSHVSMV
jgi:hypothetical protein